jgi:hypothetical protein
LAAIAGSAAVAGTVARLPFPPVPGWVRSNYRGRPVSLSGGLGAAAGVLVGAFATGPLRRSALIAAGAAAVAGAYDDLLAPRAEQGSDKGLAGHVRALRSGRVSGGVVKVTVIGVGALLASTQLPTSDSKGASLLRRVTNAGLIAGSANLLNLFDLRPGRAAKVALLGCAAIAATGGATASLATAAAVSAATLPGDLGERTMLGDLGANTLGAIIGINLATARPTVRTVAIAVVAGLTLASERVSFSNVIAGTPALRRLDEMGRTGPPPSDPAPAGPNLCAQ